MSYSNTSPAPRREHFFTASLSLLRYLFRWTLLVIPPAAAIGSAVALFLWLLDKATGLRYQYSWLLFLLPVSGVIIYVLYGRWGKNSAKGNDLVIDEIHEPGGGIPKRMAPLVLFSTVLTHLTGGSAGREGTAVQMGGSIAGVFGSWFRLDKTDQSTLLTAGIAAGFGAVFGTPLTGTIFALEVLTIGRIRYTALLPCLVAALIGDAVCLAWGIHHTQYTLLFSGHAESGPVLSGPFLSGTEKSGSLPMDFGLIGKTILAGACFGLASWLFANLTHQLKKASARYIRPSWLVPVAGAALLIGLTYCLGTRDYLGLGVTAPGDRGVSIVSAFREGGADRWSWLWKLLFTAITLGSGFKGGEVTPLFFIGAALGNTLAWLFGAPVDLFAGLGFIAVFAGATNTPLACTIMGIELFGGANTLYFAIACFSAYFFSGRQGIYPAQRQEEAKFSPPS